MQDRESIEPVRRQSAIFTLRPALHTNLEYLLFYNDRWADRWGMQFNVSKCKVMHFGHNNVQQKYWMNGQELTVTEEEVDIGVKVTKT